MKGTYTIARSESESSSSVRNSIGTWTIFAALSLLLVAVAILAYFGWTSSDASVSTAGYVAMGFGVIFSLLVGAGLMALVFYCSRKGYDEPAVLIKESGNDRDDVQQP